MGRGLSDDIEVGVETWARCQTSSVVRRMSMQGGIFSLRSGAQAD